MRIARRAAAAAAMTVIMVIGACTTTESTPPQQSSPAASDMPTTSARVDPAVCARKPPDGRIDRSAHGLAFRNGSVYVGVTPTPGATPPGPAAPSSTAPAAASCYEFAKSGNPAPGVPPDAMLFTFDGARGDGAQIEFLVVDLTGGVLPPIGPVRPTVGPLNQPINARVGVSLDGIYRQSTTCRLQITAMSPTLAAGSFDCPAAMTSDADPLNPSDDVPDDEGTAAEGSVSAEPSTPGGDAGSSGNAAALSGWYELRP